MTISRTLYIFKFKFSDVHFFCIKCKYHMSKILLRIVSKRAQIFPQIILTTKSMVFALKILLLASKPTGHLMPRCRNNFQLWAEIALLSQLWGTTLPTIRYPTPRVVFLWNWVVLGVSHFRDKCVGFTIKISCETFRFPDTWFPVSPGFSRPDLSSTISSPIFSKGTIQIKKCPKSGKSPQFSPRMIWTFLNLGKIWNLTTPPLYLISENLKLGKLWIFGTPLKYGT